MTPTVRSSMSTLTLSLSLSLLAALALPPAGCRGKAASAPPGPTAGLERGACRPDRRCDRGLTCMSDLCVRPPAADCDKVGESVAYLMLDNYAPREERAATRAHIARQCVDQGLSADDGQCLIRARSKGDLRACPRVVGFGDCARIKAHLDGLQAGNGVDAYLVTGADRIAARCRTEAPTLAFERCVLAALALADVDRCAW